MMRKYMLFLALWGIATFVHGEPEKQFEAGIKGSAGFAGNQLALGDFHNNTITVDLQRIVETDKDMHLSFDFDGKVFFNFIRKTRTFGGFFGIDGFATVLLPQDIMTFLGNTGNHTNFSGVTLVGMNLFVELGARVGRKHGKWSFDIYPAFYIPLFYIPNSGIDFNINSGDSITFTGKTDIPIYTACESVDNKWKFTGKSLDSTGFDTSIHINYHWFSNLDAGGAISHIPVVPAHMTRAQCFFFDYSVQNLDVLDIDGIQKIEFEKITNLYRTDMNFLVFRPLRFDAYISYGFLDSTFFVKPALGFSALTVYGYDKVLFNAALNLSLVKPEFMCYTLAFGYQEKIWQYTLGVQARISYVLIDLAVVFQSHEFAQALSGKGLKGCLGVTFKK